MVRLTAPPQIPEDQRQSVSDFAVGDTVKHDSAGTGRVVGFEPSRLPPHDLCVVVEFEPQRRKDGSMGRRQTGAYNALWFRTYRLTKVETK